MSISEELQKLEALRQSGSLTEAEFQRAKTAVLNAVPGGAHLLERLQLENELLRLDQAWQIEQETYKVWGRNNMVLPSNDSGGSQIIFGILFGACLVGGGLTQKNLSVFFIGAGLLVVALGLASGLHEISMKKKYDAAKTRYLEQHQVLEDQLQRF